MSDDSIRDRLKRQLARRTKPSAESALERDPTARRSVFDSLGRHARLASDEAVVPVTASAASTNSDDAAGETQPIDARVTRANHAPLARSLGDVIPLPVRELSSEPPRELELDAQGVSARIRQFAREHCHGSKSLASVFDVPRTVLAERARDERLNQVDLTRAVFFDTETTGLAGGAGTYVFLVGLMRFTGESFELWQGFLPHPAEEKNLLEEVAARIADASVLVSFFGKSFDRHRLEDKMRLHGVTPPFATTIHLDLYHPLRRAHRGRFENCKLKTLERELVGVVRPDDLPGSFAPAAWFDFLGGRPHRLEGVFQHNADDVLSLAALLCHLTED
ncbi:MAG: ribonuclease H-like domain-containing protein [Planctomycetota bacterium]|nr:ribonuclease H-like domain-containing protein [Planctomycetota bacterium]